jgi:hypothetical protein
VNEEQSGHWLSSHDFSPPSAVPPSGGPVVADASACQCFLQYLQFIFNVFRVGYGVGDLCAER